MCYAQIMLIDFHSHFPSPCALVCTATPSKESPSECLMRFEGLLPDRWSEGRQEELFFLLLSDSSIHMGEIGLDKRFAQAVSMQKQADILRRELSLAIGADRCVSLHCVRATGLMIEVLSEFRYRPFSVLWHGFTGSAETAANLHRMGVIVSIGERFTGSIGALVKANPFTVPETDYEGTDPEAYERTLRARYERFSLELGTATDELEIRSDRILCTMNPCMRNQMQP